MTSDDLSPPQWYLQALCEVHVCSTTVRYRVCNHSRRHIAPQTHPPVPPKQTHRHTSIPLHVHYYHRIYFFSLRQGINDSHHFLKRADYVNTRLLVYNLKYILLGWGKRDVLDIWDTNYIARIPYSNIHFTSNPDSETHKARWYTCLPSWLRTNWLPIQPPYLISSITNIIFQEKLLDTNNQTLLPRNDSLLAPVLLHREHMIMDDGDGIV